MNDGDVCTPSWPAAGSAAVVLMAVICLTAASTAYSQTPPATPPAPKAQPKQLPKSQPQPQQKPGDPQPQAGDQSPQLTFSPWTKFCLKGQEANARQVCFTNKDGHLESGQPVVAAVLIEPEGEPRKVLRVTLPLGMQLQSGTRVIVDQGQPMTAPYVMCFPGGCMADYEASGELVDKLKKGQGLVVQGINGQAQPVSFVLPLADFAKAYNGPPTDPKLLQQPPQK